MYAAYVTLHFCFLEARRCYKCNIKIRIVAMFLFVDIETILFISYRYQTRNLHVFYTTATLPYIM
jgi:hypothetical protein